LFLEISRSQGAKPVSFAISSLVYPSRFWDSVYLFKFILFYFTTNYTFHNSLFCHKCTKSLFRGKFIDAYFATSGKNNAFVASLLTLILPQVVKIML
jgi:hypothetical protein